MNAVFKIVCMWQSQRSGWSHSSGQPGGHHHPSGVSSETELDAQYAQVINNITLSLVYLITYSFASAT